MAGIIVNSIKRVELSQWNWDIPSNYIYYQVYIQIPTRYYVDTAGEVHCV